MEANLLKWQPVWEHLLWCAEIGIVFCSLLGTIWVLYDFTDFAFKLLKAHTRDWQNSKLFIFQDIWIYSAVIGMDLFYDLFPFICNRLIHSTRDYPLHFGRGQVFILVVFSGLLYWKIKQFMTFFPSKIKKYVPVHD